MWSSTTHSCTRCLFYFYRKSFPQAFVFREKSVISDNETEITPPKFAELVEKSQVMSNIFFLFALIRRTIKFIPSTFRSSHCRQEYLKNSKNFAKNSFPLLNVQQRLERQRKKNIKILNNREQSPLTCFFS